MVLRVRAPHAKRPFRTPFIWVTAPLGHRHVPVHDVVPAARHLLRLAVWTAIGLVIYFLYSSKHAKPSPIR